MAVKQYKVRHNSLNSLSSPPPSTPSHSFTSLSFVGHKMFFNSFALLALAASPTLANVFVWMTEIFGKEDLNIDTSSRSQTQLLLLLSTVANKLPSTGKMIARLLPSKIWAIVRSLSTSVTPCNRYVLAFYTRIPFFDVSKTSLQTIVESVDVSKTSAIQFTPKPEIGPNSAE